MRPWFLFIATVCLFVITAAFAYERVATARAARWKVMPGPRSEVVDTWRGAVCDLETCIALAALPPGAFIASRDSATGQMLVRR